MRGWVKLNQGKAVALAIYAEPRSTGRHDWRQKKVTRNNVERISI